MNKKPKPDPEHENVPRPDFAVPVTISMLTARKDMLHKMMDIQKVKASEIMRRAMDMYANHLGLKKDVKVIQRLEESLGGVYE